MVLAAALAVGASGAVQAHGAAAAAVSSQAAVHMVSDVQARAAAAYWTPERRARAQMLVAAPSIPVTRQPAVPSGPSGHVDPVVQAPASGPGVTASMAPAGDGRWTGSPTSLPAKDIGVLSLTTPGGGSAWCSASVIVADDRDLLSTAGHCVYDKNYVAANGTGWMSNYVFCPGQNGGANPTPYGCWPGRGAVTNSAWLNNRDGSYDFGFVVLATNSSGQHIADVLGNQFGVEWNQPRGSAYTIFGYPGAAPYYGVNPAWCSGTSINDTRGFSPELIGVTCSNMSHGASGGPWLRGYSSSSGWGYVNSVNSGGWSGDPHIYGSYFDSVFGSVYNSAQGL